MPFRYAEKYNLITDAFLGPGKWRRVLDSLLYLQMVYDIVLPDFSDSLRKFSICSNFRSEEHVTCPSKKKSTR